MRKFKLTVLLIFILLSLTIFTVNAGSNESNTSHIHNYKIIYTVKPTCTEKGYTYYFCSCGDNYKGDEVASVGHLYSKEYSVEVMPDCTKKGIKSVYCLRCFERGDKKEIPSLSHNIKTDIIEASFDKSGEIKTECTMCKRIFSRRNIAPVSSAKLSQNSYYYDGKMKTPVITLTDSAGNILIESEDYSVNYPNGRKKTGRYKVTVKLKGYYLGEKELYFDIKPNKVKRISFDSSTRSVRLSWSAVKGASGYRVYHYDKNKKKYIFITDTKNLSYTVRKIKGKDLDYGKDYKFAVKAYKESNNEKVLSGKIKFVSASTKPSKAVIKNVKSDGNKLHINWKKQACDGYEMMYAANKSFSSAKIIKFSGSSDTKAVINVPDTETYIKVRAFKIIGGVKEYGFYSDVEKVVR